MHGLDDGLDALFALRGEPLLERALRAHRLVQALGERDALDALALLREARLEQRDLLAQVELLLGVVAEERVRHVVVRADALPRIGQLEDRLEVLLDAVFEVAHATILSAYSTRARAGQRELHEAAGDLVVELAELMQPEELALDVRRAHQEHAPVGRCDDLARALLRLRIMACRR